MSVLIRKKDAFYFTDCPIEHATRRTGSGT